MLETTDKNTVPEAVYRALVTRPDAGVDELAGYLGLSERHIREALDALSELSLVRPASDAPHRLHVVNPQIAVELVVAEQQAALTAQQQRMEEARATALRLSAGARSRAVAVSEAGETFSGVDALHDCLAALNAAGTTDILGCIAAAPGSTATWEAPLALSEGALERGGTVKLAFPQSFRLSRNSVGTLHRARAHIRLAPALPGYVLICDRATAVVVDGDGADMQSTIVKAPGVVSLLLAQATEAWNCAVPWLADDTARSGQVLSAQEQAALELLAEGHTDAGVAKRLGVSHRTSRRIAAALMERLGARSRFQAGAVAAVRGLLRG